LEELFLVRPFVMMGVQESCQFSLALCMKEVG